MPQVIGAAIMAAASYATGGTAAAGATAASSAAFTIGTTSVSWGTVVGTIALTGLSIALTPTVSPLGRAMVGVRSTIGGRRRYYGRVRCSGNLVELKVSYILNEDGDGVLLCGTAHMSGKIDGIEQFWISGQEVRIDTVGSPGGDGQVVFPGVWFDSLRIQVEFKLGDASQVVSEYLSEAFPARWTAAHRLDGIAYTVVRLQGVPLEDFSAVYGGIGAQPNVGLTMRASLVWDPRDIYQDPDDATTWEWSQNAALIILDFLRHDDGMRLPYSLIEPALAEWQEAANYCDEEITLLSGETEPRYQLSGGYDFTEEPKEVMKRMLTPIDGWLRLREDGAVVLEPGRFVTPTDAETFSDRDILSFDLKRGASSTEVRNEIRSSYTSRGHTYNPQEADPWRDEDSIALHGIKTATLPMEWAFSHRQVRQRLKVEAARQNPEWLGTITVNARGLNLMGKRYARFIIDGILDATFFIIRQNINLLVGACTLEVVSFPSTAYDWDPTEEGVSPEHAAPGNHGIVVPNGTTEVTITVDGGGGGGSTGVGGGGAARSVKTMAIDPADWGSVILFTVGAPGQFVHAGPSTDGGDSTVTGSIVAGAINMVAGGGTSGDSGGGGGTASGGDTNTSGFASAGGDGGEAGSGAVDVGSPNGEAPGAGGHEGGDGGKGRVTFDWVF